MEGVNRVVSQGLSVSVPRACGLCGDIVSSHLSAGSHCL